MSDSSVIVQFGGDTKNLQQQILAAQSTITQAAGRIQSSMDGANPAIARMQAQMDALTESTKKTADSTEALKSYADWQLKLNAVKLGYDAVSMAVSGTSSVVTGTASLIWSAVSKTGDIVLLAATSFRNYAESQAYSAQYAPLVMMANDGLIASYGRLSLAIDQHFRAAAIYSSGMLEAAQSSIAMTGSLDQLEAAAQKGGFSNLVRMMQDYASQLTSIKDMTNETAVSIENSFLHIPGITADLNQSLINITTQLNTTQDAAQKFATALSGALTNPSANGQAYLSSLGNVSTSLQEWYSYAQRINNVGLMQNTILQATIEQERLVAQAKLQPLQDQLKAYNDLGIVGRLLSGVLSGQVTQAKEFIEALNEQEEKLKEEAATFQQIAQTSDQVRASMDKMVTSMNPLTYQLQSVTSQIKLMKQGMDESAMSAADMIKKLESFSAAAYKDSDGKWRVGYGSDTQNGQAVDQNTTTTREAAEQDLAQRIVEFQQKAADQIGTAWEGLSARAKASITSVTYNYGHVPDSVVGAAKTGNDSQIADAIRSLSANPQRRQEEANNITTGNTEGSSGEGSAREEVANQLNDKQQQLNDLKAGGSAIDKAALATAQATLDGKKDEVTAAQQAVEAVQKQLSVTHDLATRQQLQKQLIQDQITLQDKLTEQKKSELELGVANAADDPKSQYDAKQKLYDFELSLYQKDSAAYNQVLVQKAAADTAYENSKTTQTVASENSQYEITTQGFQRRKLLLQQELQDGQINRSQKLSADLQLETEQEAVERKHFTFLRDQYTEGTNEYQNYNLKLQQIDATSATKRQQIVTQENKAIQQSYNQTFESIGSTITSSLMQMIQGTQRFSDLLKNVSLKIIEMFVSAGVKMVADWAAKQALMLMHTVTSQTAQTAATATGAAARTGISAGEAAAEGATKVESMIASIMSSSAETFAGVFGFLSPVMGPAAAAPATAAQATVAAAAGSVAAFDIGAWNLPNDQLAMVHKNELIMPAPQAAAFRDMLSSGGGQGGGQGDVHLHVHALDHRSVSQLFRDHGRTMAQTMKDVLNKNPGLRPSY